MFLYISMVAVCLVQRLLEEFKQSNPQNATLHIFKFDTYSRRLIIMDDFMKLFVPK